MDATYQKIRVLECDQDIRKETFCIYKNQLHVIKVTICCNGEGIPFFAFCTYSDQKHTDAKIWKMVSNTKFLEYWINNFDSDDNAENQLYCAGTKDVALVLQKFQTMLKPQDKCITDNGYDPQDRNIITPLAPPDANQD
eukprot:403294_1